MANPLLEHLDEEASVPGRGHRALGHLVAGRDPPGRGPFHDGDELHEVGAQVVAQEPVDIQAVILIGPVNGRQHVPAHPAPLQQVQAADHPVEGGLAALVHPVGIMQVAGSVDGDPDQEVVLGKKGGPLVVEEGVCMVFSKIMPGRWYWFWYAMARL